MTSFENLDSSEIRTESVDFSFGEILNLHKDREIVIRPEYQRLFRWSYEQRSRLIESILLRLPIPPIFLIEDEYGVLELIDGLQRTSSVLQFLENDAIGEPVLRLTGCDILQELNGLTYEDFPTSIRLRLKRTPIRAVIIKQSGDDFVKYEMFKRLNTGGELLSAQEIRNCSSRMIRDGAEFYSKLQSCAQQQSFILATGRIPQPEKEKRADEELVLRFFAVQQFRDHFRGSVREWLDEFMETILFHPDQIQLNLQLFSDFFRTISSKVGDTAFSRHRNGEAVGRLAPAYFEAVSGALYDKVGFLAELPSQEIKARLIRAFDDPDFLEATGPGANSREKLENRIRAVRRYFD